MRLFNSPRTMLRRLSVSVMAAAAMVSIVIAAVPGFPFTEDFTDTNLRDATLDTATWDTAAPGTLRLGTAESLTTLTGVQASLAAAVDVPRETRGIVLGDFDGDGDLDAAVANRNDNVNLVYFNTLGLFDSAPVNLGSDALDTLSIATADIDGDGDLDIVTGNRQDPNLYYINDGSGNFADGVEVAADSNRTWPIMLVDVDGDGDLDLIEGVDGNRNQLYINRDYETGGVSFAAGVQIGSQQNDTRSMAVGDINGDGVVDLVAGDHAAANIAYLGDGVGGFDGGTAIQAGEVYNTFALALADLDGDGDLDLIEGAQNNAGVDGESRVYDNDGSGNFAASAVITGSDSAHTTTALLALDFDRDGDIDVLEGNNSGAAVVPNRLFLNNGAAAPTIVDVTATFFERTYGLAAGDLDGDGDLDFVAGNQNAAGSPTPSLNSAYYMGGVASGTSFTQLQSRGVSLEVDGANDNIRFARVTMNGSVPLQAGLDFYLSNDDGVSWQPVTPNGRPIRFTNDDNQLKWKAELSTSSPNAAQLPTISDFTISGGNSNPNYDGPITVSGSEGVNFQFQLDFDDADGDVLTYQIGTLPAGSGLSVDNITGVVSGVLTPADTAASPYVFRAFAFDGASTGSTANDGDITLTVGGLDSTPPVITLVGPSSVTVALGDAYADQGATAADNIDGDITANIVTTNPVDTNTEGSYIVRYNVTDSSGNAAPEVVRNVTVSAVVDSTPPVITLVGPATVAVTVGNAYTDQGATATDDTDGDITANIVTVNSVNTALAGSYTVTYNVSDAAGNAATQVTRNVTVNSVVVPPPPTGGGGGGATSTWEFAALALFGLLAIVGRRGRRQGKVTIA